MTAFRVSPAAVARPRPMDDRRGVVVGTDSSDCGLAALSWAAQQAALFGVELEVCVALPEHGFDRAVARRLSEVRQANPTETVAVSASTDAASALIAASHHAGVVVQGRRGTGHHALGIGASVPHVAQSAACDVVVVGGRHTAILGAHRCVTAVLPDAAHGPDLSAATVRSAARVARSRGARLEVVEQVSPAGRGPAPDVPADSPALRAAIALAAQLAPSLDVRATVVCGHPIEVITRITGTDVLAVAAHGQLDALARAALHHATAPVLIARA